MIPIRNTWELSVDRMRWDERSFEAPLGQCTAELADRRKALRMAIAAETELYRERMAAYERQLADIEREACCALRLSAAGLR